ncbi:MAG: hypothetical protein H0V17_25460 [Deltaproteobacteria bacterium]|nr:hypothetical protein [Deltaproteobacteria bacterium]
MKILLALAVLAVSPATAEADCACGAWLLTESVVEGQPSIVIEMSCATKAPKLVIEDPSGKPAKVTLTATHGGQGSTQYVFQPERPLAPGKHTVVAGGQPPKHVLTVVAAPPNAAPATWSSAPSVTSQTQTEFGCGPAKSVMVTAGSAASLAYVELVDDGSKRRSAGYVRVKNGELSIGHGMCGGAFELVKARSYTAAITLLAPERGTSASSKTVSFKYSP